MMATKSRSSVPRGSCAGCRAFVPAVVLLACCLVGGAGAALEDTIRVRLEEGQSLRDLAEEHLGDPDLWVEILRANDIESVTAIRPGLELVIPVGPIAAADQALRDALGLIQQATQEGARVFAPELIARALELYEAAQAERKAGAWEAVARLAGDAGTVAADAMETALADRDSAAEALLSDRQGWVEGQRPQEHLWSDRDLHDLLVEEEKVRTLSRSSAQITFRDDSRLRLNANSQAVIQRMRADPLSRREEAKVTLLAGDFYALLSGRSARRQFELEVPEVQTRIESTDFWVSRDAASAKFANYDTGVIEVAAAGASVSLGKDEGTVVRTGEAPSPPQPVLPPPALAAPADDAITYEAEIALQWEPVPDAAGYWLEIAQDQGFARMVETRWGLTAPRFEAGGLDVGMYYWRVHALDKFGLPGARSEAWRVNVRTDTAPPYLAVRDPADGAILRAAPLTLIGESEPGAQLTIDGRAVPTDPGGRFEAVLDPDPGPNEITVEARDAAGNVSRHTRQFVFMPDQEAPLVFDPAIPRQSPLHFLTSRDTASLAGTTAASARIEVLGPDGEVRAATRAGEDGRFAVNVSLVADSETFAVEIVAPSGFTSLHGFSVSIDRDPPTIRLDAPPPVVTSVEWLPLRGRAIDGAELHLNDERVPLVDERFEETVSLVAGANRLEMVATDQVGNVRVERFEVQLDQEPPQLIEYRLSPRDLVDGAPVTVEVTASDPSGLKRAARATLVVGGASYSDLLEFDPASSSYRGQLILPPGTAGRVRLKDVELEDYAGNRQRYIIE